MYWGIDLGGTKIEGVVLSSLSTDGVVARHRVATAQELGYEAIIEKIAALVTELSRLSGASPKLIGFGTPGVLDLRTQLLKNSNTLCLNSKPLRQDLEQTLRTPVVIQNDANCFALAEAL